MKLIQQTKLFFKKGTSDKVYEVDLCAVGDNQYVVNFRYGRRGTNLKDGTKTSSPVDKTKAEQIYEALIAEKRKGGYKSETETFQELPTINNPAPDSLEGVILQRLQNAIDGKNTYKTQWKISRVAWKVGELKLNNAVPYLIKLVEKGNDMQRYSILWALARCADERAIPTFQAYYSNSKYAANVRKIAGEGLLRTLKAEDKDKFIQNVLEKLPDEIRLLVVDNNQEELKKSVLERLKEKQTEFNFLETLYALIYKYPFITKILAECFYSITLRPPHFRHIRSIYKLAELRDDALFLGICSYQFEKTPAMYKAPKNKWKNNVFVPELNEKITIKQEIKKKDTKIAFSDKTKNYFLRRLLLNLQDVGERDGIFYVKLATAILLQYKQEDYSPKSKYSLDYDEHGVWDKKLKKYRHSYVDLPECNKCVLLNQILIGGDTDNFVLNKMSWQWRSKEVKQVLTDEFYFSSEDINNQSDNPQKDSATNSLIEWVNKLIDSNKRTEIFPEHWDKFPQAYLQLLMQGKLDLIHEFAFKNLKNHAQYQEIVNKIDEKMIVSLLSSDFQIPAWFALEIVKERIKSNIDRNLILVLLASKLLEARQFAQELIQKDVQSYINESNFVTSLLLNPYQDVRIWANTYLSKVSFTPDQQKVMVGKTVVEMLAIKENSPENNEKVADTIAFLVQVAPHILENISWKVIEELLNSPLEQNNILASEIIVLKLKNIAAEQIPLNILEGFFKSHLENLRKNGMIIFAQYPEHKLLEAIELLSQMLNSPFQHIREGAKLICQKLVEKNDSFANQLTSLLITLMMRKETYEGSHEFLANFLINYLKNHLSQIPLKTVLNLIYGNYRQGQFVGFHILKNHIPSNDLTIRQVISLANHELLAIRHWTLQFYQQNVSRIRFEREEALRILDSKWEDIRKIAMDFFRQNFTNEHWSIDSLVSIADSVRPDVEAFGKEMITKFFTEEDGILYLTKLSQHPSVSMQMFTSNYLERYASDNYDRLQDLEFYFKSTLTRVNKARITKERVFAFLEKEALKSAKVAQWVANILNELVVINAIEDKARCIELLHKFKTKFPEIQVEIELVNSYQ
ncbi:MAG: hypothetical protein OHK0038_20880 [Flammeovirgaceae bacterium]